MAEIVIHPANGGKSGQTGDRASACRHKLSDQNEGRQARCSPRCRRSPWGLRPGSGHRNRPSACCAKTRGRKSTCCLAASWVESDSFRSAPVRSSARGRDDCRVRAPVSVWFPEPPPSHRRSARGQCEAESRRRAGVRGCPGGASWAVGYFARIAWQAIWEKSSAESQTPNSPSSGAATADRRKRGVSRWFEQRLSQFAYWGDLLNKNLWNRRLGTEIGRVFNIVASHLSAGLRSIVPSTVRSGPLLPAQHSPLGGFTKFGCSTGAR